MSRLIFVVIIISLTNFHIAYAGFNVGTSVLYADIKDPKYPYLDNYEPKLQGINVGYNHNIEGLDISISTNRLLNKASRRNVSCSGQVCTSVSKMTYDSLQIGYMINRFIPAIFIANTNLDKSLYYNDKIVGRARNSFIAYGFGTTYILNKNITTSMNIIMPNQEVHLKKGVSLSINYHF
jgi:hypothetical protein